MSKISNTATDAILARSLSNGDLLNVVGIAANNESNIYQGAFGPLSRTNDQPTALDTIFRIASMTKAVTSVAAMQSIERGLLQLDAPVYNYIPAFSELKILEGIDKSSGHPIYRQPKNPVTVKQLLTHTSGFGYEMWNTQLRDAVAGGVMPGIFSKADGILDAPLVFDPGSQWHYGVSTDWLGRLVEVVHGKTLDTVFDEFILEPLGMNDTHFILPENKHARLVPAQARQEDGTLTELPSAPPSEPTFMRGGDGLFSTASDYILFLRALLGKGELNGVRILNPDTVALMGQNHIGGLQAGAMNTVNPGMSNSFNISPNSIDKFGLGFLVHSDGVPGGRSAGSLSWAGIYNSYFWIDPALSVCGLILTQVLPFYDEKAVSTLRDFEVSIYDQLARK